MLSTLDKKVLGIVKVSLPQHVTTENELPGIPNKAKSMPYLLFPFYNGEDKVQTSDIY